MQKMTISALTVVLLLLAGCSDGPGKKEVATIYGNSLEKLQALQSIADKELELNLLSIDGLDCKKDGEIYYICTGKANVEIKGSKNQNNNKTLSKEFKMKLKNNNGNWVDANSEWK